MGSGDWNDGMNLVGIHGKGESVWLAFFLYAVLEDFGALATLRGDSGFADRCRHEAATLRENIERGAWDGDTLALRVTTPKAEGRYTYHFQGDDRYDFRIENSFDGGKTFVKFMEGTYRRSVAASPR